MDDTTRSIIRNVKGPGTKNPTAGIMGAPSFISSTLDKESANICPSIVREDDILCLLESEREARRLR